MSKIIDTKLWQEAQKWAESVSQHILESSQDATKSLNKEESRIYKELVAFGWFDMFPIDSNKSATEMHLAIQKYGKLKWKKEHPSKDKPSKWEVVTGRNIRRPS